MPTILLVDDRPPNREVLATLLSYKGYLTLEAGDGEEALHLARRQPPDLVITDILMPTMDGYDLVRAMRADPALAKIPVIFATAHYHEREAQGLADIAGVTFVLPKPCEPEIILRTVAAALAGEPSSAASPPPPPLDESLFDREHFRVLTDKLRTKVDILNALQERQQAMVEFCLTLSAETDQDKLFAELCRVIRRIIAAREVAVGVLDSSRENFAHFFTSGIPHRVVQALAAFPRHDGPLGEVLERNQASRGHGLPGDPRLVGLPAGYPPVHSFLIVPIATPRRAYGWICLTNKIGLDEFGTDDEHLAFSFAAQSARVYESNRLYRKLQKRNARLLAEIDEHKRAETALRQSEERFRDVAEASTDWVWETDASLRFSYFSDRIRDFGIDPAALVGKSFAALAAEPIGGAKAEEFHLTLRQRQPFRDIVYTMGLPGKKVRLVKISGKPVGGAGGFAGYRGVGSDFTALHEAEQALRQSQKMEAVGQLTGGIAHDFNNLLTVIIGNAEILSEAVQSDPALAVQAEGITRTAERAAQLTHRLLAFSRRQTLMPRRVEVANLLEGMGDLLKRTLGEHIEIRIAPAAGLWPILVDGSQLENALLNLAVNARDAMTGGGVLTIEAANAELDEAYAEGHPGMQPGPHVMIKVGDNGSGIAPEHLGRIFEPFFTTKEPGQGTGLGLAMVYGFIKQSDGYIDVDSEVGRGTRIQLYLPRAAEGVRPASDRYAPNGEIPRGSETILVVEDERLVRDFVTQQLQALGYTVILAVDGPDALAALAQSPVVDLLLTDVVLPGGQNGPEVAETARLRRPGLRVLYTSGYADTGRRKALDPGAILLHKPYRKLDLARKVREALEAR